MPDYSWNIAQQMKSGDYWKPRYVKGGIGLDFQSTPSYYTNAAGARVDISDPSSWYRLPGGATAKASNTGTTSGSNASGFSTISNVKSQPIQDAIDKALGDWNSNRTSYANDLSKFRSESDASRAGTRGFLDQENANVGSYFSGGVESRLDDLLGKYKTATALAADQAASQALGAYKTAGLSGASDIYRNRMIDQALQSIRAKQAKDVADQELANYQWLAGMQRGLLGQRAAAESAYVDTGLKPLNASMAVNQNVLAALGQINSANLANNFYGVNAPYTPSIYGLQNFGPYSGGYGGGYYPYMAPSSYGYSAIPNAVRTVSATQPSTAWNANSWLTPTIATTPVGNYGISNNYPVMTVEQGNQWYQDYLKQPSNVSVYPGITNEWGLL